MPFLITALTRTATLNQTMGEKNIQQNRQNEKKTYFTAKLKHLSLKAPSNNVKLQSEENLTTQVYIFVTTQVYLFVTGILY